jgi:hypothetical protein
MSRQATIPWLCAALLAAVGCVDTEPVVRLGKLVQEPVAGAPAMDPWQSLAEHARWEMEYFQCMQNQPVCGSDGVTYQNPCLAARAGIAVDSDGGC